MDFALLTLPDWPALVRITDAPEPIVAAFVSAVATLALLVGLAPRLLAPRQRSRAIASGTGAACEFLVNGASVKPLTEPARALLDALEAKGSRLAALSEHLAGDDGRLRKDIEALVLYGQPFRRQLPRGDGAQNEIVGTPRGGAAFLSIRPASEDARALQDARRGLDRAEVEAGFLREALDRAPIAVWSMGPDGQVVWANAGYRERFEAPGDGPPDHRIPNAFEHVIEEVPLTAPEGVVRRRVSIPGPRNSEPHWYEVRQIAGPAGATLGFASPADELVAAESFLRRFVETLTETFAHLPIGLAVFDKNRRLGLFNPALTDLVKIDAVWLAGRPSLRDFLERLRETRQMPEQKDFAAWRRQLTELEEGAREGTYEQNWELPSGKIFRVTGRPHPQGALAFLFEDISTAIMLERRYRSELELSQATLDRMSEAVAVFDASGMLVFVNNAFETLWGLDPMQKLDGPSVKEMTGMCAARCAPNPAWGRLAEFATAADARSSWTADVATLDGRALRLLVAPLPDASALVVFRDHGAVDEAGAAPGARSAGGRDDVLEEIALDRIHAPVEAAIRNLMAAIPAARSNEAFEALSGVAQRLKDGLARSRELRVLADRAENGSLAGLLRERGLSLAAPEDHHDWPDDLRRIAATAALAAAESATAGAEIALTLDAGSGDAGAGARAIGVACPAARAPRKDGVNLALARRLAEEAGGTLEARFEGGALSLVAKLPAATMPLGAEIARSA